MAANAVKYIALTGGIAALGWAVMHYTSPNRDVFIEKISDKSQIEKTSKRNEELFQALEQSMKSNEPVWKVKVPPITTHNNKSEN
jgi:hypothetical protein